LGESCGNTLHLTYLEYVSFPTWPFLYGTSKTEENFYDAFPNLAIYPRRFMRSDIETYYLGRGLKSNVNSYFECDILARSTALGPIIFLGISFGYEERE
jgi:hypothetical protein